MELAVTHKLKIVPVRPEMVKKIQEKFPYVALEKIPAGTYKNQTAPVELIAWDTYLMANAQLPADVGYRVVKALLENTQELVSHPAGAYWTLEKTARKMIVPRHPGAVKYLQEKGLLK
jgi:TRAP transporter TAXI family solute receptor